MILELWNFLRTRKKLWLLPVILLLAVFGVFLILLQTTAVGPLIYTLF